MLAGNDAFSPSFYEQIATSFATGSSNTITFSSIPQTYKHLQIRIAARSGSTGTNETDLNLILNGDSSQIYARHFLLGNGSTVTSGATASTNFMIATTIPAASANASIFAGAIIDILDYSVTTKNKTVRSFSGTPGASGQAAIQVALRSGFSSSTLAVTSLTLTSGGNGNLLSSSRFSLYGIKG
jgi:hypothetical protein